MPKVTHVKKARKDNGTYGIKAGESYYWWKFRYSGKICSKTKPKSSQLTQSEFYGNVYTLQEQIEELQEVDQDTLDELAANIQEIGEDCTEKLGNMPDSLQYSTTGELLQERADAMESWSSEIEGIEIPEEVDVPGDEPEEEDFQDIDQYDTAAEEWEELDRAYTEYTDALASALDELKSFCPEMP